MPTYQYACTSCGERLEAVQKFSDDPLTVCPACEGRLRKVFSAVGVVFKGSGFYKTDSRSSGSRSTASDAPSTAASGDAPAKNADSSSESSGSSSGDASSSTPSSPGPSSSPASSGSGSSGASGGKDSSKVA